MTPAAVRSLASHTVEVLRKLRAKFAGRDFSSAEKEFAAEIIAAKLDYESVKGLFTRTKLADAQN